MKRFLILPLCMAGFISAPAHAEYCREFTKDVYVGGRLQQAYGTSCMQPDGSWQIVQQPTVMQQPTIIQQQPVTYVQPVSYVQPVTYYDSGYSRPYYNPTYVSLSFGSRNSWGRYSNYRGHGWGHRSHGWRGRGHGHHW